MGNGGADTGCGGADVGGGAVNMGSGGVMLAMEERTLEAWNCMGFGGIKAVEGWVSTVEGLDM